MKARHPRGSRAGSCTRACYPTHGLAASVEVRSPRALDSSTIQLAVATVSLPAGTSKTRIPITYYSRSENQGLRPEGLSVDILADVIYTIRVRSTHRVFLGSPTKFTYVISIMPHTDSICAECLSPDIRCWSIFSRPFAWKSTDPEAAAKQRLLPVDI